MQRGLFRRRLIAVLATATTAAAMTLSPATAAPSTNTTTTDTPTTDARPFVSGAQKRRQRPRDGRHHPPG